MTDSSRADKTQTTETEAHARACWARGEPWTACCQISDDPALQIAWAAAWHAAERESRERRGIVEDIIKQVSGA